MPRRSRLMALSLARLGLQSSQIRSSPEGQKGRLVNANLGVLDDNAGVVQHATLASTRNERSDAETFQTHDYAHTPDWHATRHQHAQRFLDQFVRQNAREIGDLPIDLIVRPVGMYTTEGIVYKGLQVLLEDAEFEINPLRLTGCIIPRVTSCDHTWTGTCGTGGLSTLRKFVLDGRSSRAEWIVQGLPLNKLILTGESPREFHDLAENIIISTIVGVVTIAAITAGKEALKRNILSRDPQPPTELALKSCLGPWARQWSGLYTGI